MKYSKPVVKSAMKDGQPVKPLGKCYDTYKCKKYSCTGIWRCNYSFKCSSYSNVS